MRFGLRTILIAVAIAAFVCLGISQVLHVRQTAKRNARANMIKGIVLAIYNYASANGRLPPPTRFAPDDPDTPLFSWRLSILPQYASYKMDINPNLPWDDATNARWRGISQPFAIGGWGEGAWDTRLPAGVPTETSIYAITGPSTAFGDGNENEPISIPPETIILAEIAASGHHWMAPGDFDIRTMSHEIDAPNGKSISGNIEGGFFIAFADSQVWFMSKSTPYNSLSKFFTIDGAKEYDRDTILGPYRIK